MNNKQNLQFLVNQNDTSFSLHGQLLDKQLLRVRSFLSIDSNNKNVISCSTSRKDNKNERHSNYIFNHKTYLITDQNVITHKQQQQSSFISTEAK
jgi:hypothetical protein